MFLNVLCACTRVLDATEWRRTWELYFIWLKTHFLYFAFHSFKFWFILLHSSDKKIAHSCGKVKDYAPILEMCIGKLTRNYANFHSPLFLPFLQGAWGCQMCSLSKKNIRKVRSGVILFLLKNICTTQYMMKSTTDRVTPSRHICVMRHLRS